MHLVREHHRPLYVVLFQYLTLQAFESFRVEHKRFEYPLKKNNFFSRNPPHRVILADQLEIGYSNMQCT